MTIKLLAICEPDSYKNFSEDVPSFYYHLARNKRIDFLHLPTHEIYNNLYESALVKFAKIKHEDLTYQKFKNLNAQVNSLESLQNIDLVYCRTLKPFPPNYLERLSQWEKHTHFVNLPSKKIEQIKADFLLKVARNYIPETIVTDDWQEALTFWEKHQTIVAKQVNSCRGRGVFKISYENGSFLVDNLLLGCQLFNNFGALIKYIQGTSHQPLQLTRYLSQVIQGDKRVVVVDGEIYGAYLRRSKSGYWVNNMSGDGECILTEISELEREAITKTVVHYQQRGLHTLGYDFLLDDQGSWCISEINAGNIGGFARLEQLTGKPIMKKFIDWLITFAQQCNIKFHNPKNQI